MADKALMALNLVSGVASGAAQRKAYRAEAAALEEDARLTQLQGAFDAADAARDSRAAIGEMIAASGSDPGAGSMADIIRQSLIEREYEKMNIAYAASGKAAQLQNRAAQARKAGRNAMVGGLINAGAAALGAYNETRSRAEQRRLTDRLYSSQRSGFMPVPEGQGPIVRAKGWDPMMYLREGGYGN